MILEISLMLILFTMTMALSRAEDRPDGDITGAGENYVSIKAGNKWNQVDGVVLEEGRSYRFSVKGTWYDASTRVDAKGYSSDNVPKWRRILFSWTEHWRRIPDADWFSLICTIGKDYATQTDIGGMLKNSGTSEIDLIAQNTGQLYCFANDLPFMYWNNKGAISLKIVPLDGPGK